jgi:type IV secretion system protein VirB2
MEIVMSANQFFKNLSPLKSVLPAVLLGAYGFAHASTSGGLPWDSALTTLQNDLTGPVATAISTVAFLAAGAALVFGEETGGIVKKLLAIVMAVALIVLGNKFLSALGLTGALVG